MTFTLSVNVPLPTARRARRPTCQKTLAPFSGSFAAMAAFSDRQKHGHARRSATTRGEARNERVELSRSSVTQRALHRRRKRSKGPLPIDAARAAMRRDGVLLALRVARRRRNPSCRCSETHDVAACFDPRRDRASCVSFSVGSIMSSVHAPKARAALSSPSYRLFDNRGETMVARRSARSG